MYGAKKVFLNCALTLRTWVEHLYHQFNYTKLINV